MAIPVKKAGTRSGPPMTAGLHPAVVTAVKDMGEQPDSYNPGKTRRQVLVTFKNAGGFEAARWYTPSWHEKANYRKDLEGVFAGSEVPEKYRTDAEQLVGLQCQVLTTQVKNTKGYVNGKVSNVLPPVAGQNVVPATPPPAAGPDNADDDPPF